MEDPDSERVTTASGDFLAEDRGAGSLTLKMPTDVVEIRPESAILRDGEGNPETIPNDVVFTMESSVRTARIGVYSLLNLPKQVPDIAPTQYDIRNLLKAARAINNGEPFPGERLLHRVLDKTYFAHILPPLPEDEPGTMRRIEEELGGLFGKGERAVQSLIDQIAGLRDKLSGGHDTKEG